MKKLSLFLMAMVLAGSFAFAHEDQDDEHSKIRQFTSPKFNLTEVTNTSVITGTFKKMSVLIEKLSDKKKVSYKGWIMKGEKKLPLLISYKDKKLHGDFNGNKFIYSKMDKKNQSYTFKTGKGEAKVSYLFEMRDGRHQINPLFIVKNNKRNYMVRLKGECCVGHGLYYAAVIYGLTTFDDEVKAKSHKDHDHDHERQYKNQKKEDHKH